MKWVFLVTTASSPSAARAYVDGYGVDFGWAVNGGDDLLWDIAMGSGGGSFSVPFIVAIDAEAMTYVNDSRDWYFDYLATARALGSD